MKIDFEFQTQYGVYRDALYLEDNHNFTSQEIDALKQERVNNWIFAIENPPITQSEIVEIYGVSYEKVEIDGQVMLKALEV